MLSDSKTVTLLIVSSLLISLFKNFTKINYTSPSLYYAKFSISWFGSAMQILLSSTGEYFKLQFVTITRITYKPVPCLQKKIESIYLYGGERDLYHLQTLSDEGEMKHFWYQWQFTYIKLVFVVGSISIYCSCLTDKFYPIVLVTFCVI